MLRALFFKDSLLQARSAEFLVLYCGFSILGSVIVSFGVSQLLFSVETLRRVAPTLVWLIFLFTATASVSKLQEQEEDLCGQQGLLLLGVSPVSMYLAKLLSAVVLLYLGHVLSWCIVGMLLNLAMPAAWMTMMAVSFGVIVCYASMALLLMPMLHGSRSRQLLFPLILLPLLAPLFFCAIELWSILLSYGAIDWEEPWLSLLFGMVVVYPVLGANMYQFVVRE
ncbi:MAG: heme exporter protein CcmB [Bdellovibrionota bacterium]|nr:MAG: heme exporter protein CcmB [Bdellovibrionota bacterium]